MRAALSTLEVVRPRSLPEALAALGEARGDGRIVPLAGGTDVFVYLNAGTAPGRVYLDLLGLDALRGVRLGREGLACGALTTFRELREHPGVRRRYPALAAAAAEVGGWQIQNRATLAGNVANASPAGDSLPVLLAHDAEVEAASARGSRVVAFGELFRGYRELALEPDELIASIRLPSPPPRTRAFFRKVGTRSAQSISKVVVAARATPDRDRRLRQVRLAFGSVAPVPVRARRAERLLEGGVPSPELADRARAALAEDLAPIDDIRSSRDYRVAVAGNLVAQFLRSLER